MKEGIFNGARFAIRLLYSIPRGVRHLWRTLLVWGRILGIYNCAGVREVRRFLRGREAMKGNPHRKSQREKDKGLPHNPWY